MYYTYGFLLLVFLLLLVISAESTVMLCYFHLNAQVNFYHKILTYSKNPNNLDT